MCTEFWLESLKGRDVLEDIGVKGEDDIKMYLREIGLEGVDWIHLAQSKDWYW
jgi:hypothetical protein